MTIIRDGKTAKPGKEFSIVGVGGAGVEAVGDDVVARQLEPHVAGVRAVLDAADGVDEGVLDQRTTHGAPPRLQERVGHGAADDEE